MSDQTSTTPRPPRSGDKTMLVGMTSTATSIIAGTLHYALQFIPIASRPSEALVFGWAAIIAPLAVAIYTKLGRKIGVDE